MSELAGGPIDRSHIRSSTVSHYDSYLKLETEAKMIEERRKEEEGHRLQILEKNPSYVD